MQEDDVNIAIEVAKEGMNQSVEHLQQELMKIRAGKASPSMLSGIKVDYYGSSTPLNQVANVAASDSKTLTIQPWEKSMIGPIEKAIFEANIGVTPQNNGEQVIINIPPVTEDRRKELVKQAKKLGEDAKVSLRTVRRDAMDKLKKAIKEGYPEDAGKRKEKEIDDMTKSHSDKVDKIIEGKEKEIMTI